jgi:hypothetical protein
MAAPHGVWGIWSARGQEPYTFSEAFKWLMSAIAPESIIATCEPGCVQQYDLPMASTRRLLFSSMPAEAEMCQAPDMENFGSFLVNQWLPFAMQIYSTIPVIL